jgi:carbon-monoxide dehydrogenase large subunit
MTKVERLLGSRALRVEDPAILNGTATFSADLSLPNMVHMAILRSAHAHAELVRVDVSDALRMPGVVRVVTSADLAGKLMPLPCIWIPGGAESHFPSHPMGVPGAGPILATDRVRYIGDPIAAVVAETREQAEEALAAIKVDYRVLPVVTTPAEALADGAPRLHDDVVGNLNALCTYGDAAAADAALDSAEVTIELETWNQRTINSPLEPRAGLGEFVPETGEYVFRGTSQSPHDHKLLLALMVMGIPYNKLRIISPNMGGSFGTKGYLYSDMPLVLWLAKQLGRPVKWVDSREGLMRSTVQGRDQHMHGWLAGTKDGRITGLKVKSLANLGAYPSTIGPGVATAMVGRCVTSVYDIAAAFAEVKAVFTNVVPLGAQRGSGRSEATHLIERMIEQYAHKIGMEPAEVRLKNMVRPDQMPFDNRMGWLYDSGDYPGTFRHALALAGYDDVATLKAEALTRGKLLGIAAVPFVAVSGVGPSPRMSREGMLGGTWESANIRVHPTGEVTVIIGSKPHGQGHETSFGQVAADVLGIPLSMVQVLHSDTKRAPFGQGSYGSRSFSVGGAAVHRAALLVRDKLIALAAHMFGVPADQIVYHAGKLHPNGEPGKAKTLQEVTLAMWYGWDLPVGMDPNLDITTFYDPPDFNFPHGAQVCIVEVDPRTGVTEVVKFVGVHDVGVQGNAMIVEGQVHGGIAHGIGQALWEEAVFAADGQLVSRDLETYALPRATSLPNFNVETHTSPTPNTPLGAKGAGEISTIGSPVVVVNAVCDALSGYGVNHIEMPLKPERVWRAIQEAKSATKAAK